MNTLTTTTLGVPVQGPANNQALAFLDKAVAGFKSLGLVLPQPEDAPIQKLLSRVSTFGQDEAMVISLVLNRQQAFNQMAREQISGMQIANRQEKVVAMFNDVVSDAKTQVKLVDNGKLSFAGKFQIWWMETRRGNFPTRFTKIGQTYNSVSKDLGDQVEREQTILDAYQQFRFALKNSEVQANILLQRAEVTVAESKALLEQAQAEVTSFPADGDATRRSELELQRDLKINEHGEVDSAYQVAKDMRDQLQLAYTASEFIFASIKQGNNLKARMYEQAVAFFGTSDIVLTGLAVKFTQNHGMAEAAATSQAMTDGIGKALDHLSEVSGQNMEAALRAGYGPSIRAENLVRFIEHTVDFQEKQMAMIADLRQETTANTDRAAEAGEEGKRRFAALLTRA
jgi:hypothetical protein